MKHHRDISRNLLTSGLVLLVGTTLGCQMTDPALTGTSTDTEAEITERTANVPRPGGLRRTTTPGQASGLSDETREIERRLGYE